MALKRGAPAETSGADDGDDTEQKIRNGADRVAGWVFVVCCYSPAALETSQDLELSAGHLNERGAAGQRVTGPYIVSCSATSAEVL